MHTALQDRAALQRHDRPRARRLARGRRRARRWSPNRARRRADFAAKVAAEYEAIRVERARRRQGRSSSTLAEARANAFTIDWSAYAPPKPARPGTRVFADYPLHELVERIDWTPFFRAWELAGNYPAILEDKVVGESARKLFADAREMLDQIVREKWLTAKGVVGFWPCRRDGDDVVLFEDDTRSQGDLAALLPAPAGREARGPRQHVPGRLHRRPRPTGSAASP